MDIQSQHEHAGTGSGAIRLLVCDGSALVRSELTRLLSGHPSVVLVDCARNLREAVEKTRTLRPDVVAIDVESPTFGGPRGAAEVLRSGCARGGDGPVVLACCRESNASAHSGLRALAEGASDVVVLHGERLSREPLACRDEIVRAAIVLHADRVTQRAVEVRVRSRGPVMPELQRASLIAIGAGEGGPMVLESLLAMVPPALPCPIVIAQRARLGCTRALAERLDGMTAIAVVHGESGMPLHPGVAYVVPSGSIGRVRSLGPGPARLELMPSTDDDSRVDALFCSCARHARSGCLGIVLSGTGEDGAVGGREILAARGTLIAQSISEALCVGMPSAALRAGGCAAGVDWIATGLGEPIGPLASAA
jgi:two-component system, chemotaxis family, protein-glutamate methylesterase/glutaminase